MKKITVLGLGPGDRKYLTLQAVSVMRETERLFLRTERCDAADYLKEQGISFDTMDDLFEVAEDFDWLTRLIVERLKQAAKGASVVFAVIDPASDDAVRQLFELGAVREVIPCVAVSGTLPGNTFDCRVVSATALPETLGDETLLITEIDRRTLAGEIKLQLMSWFGQDCPVVFYPPVWTNGKRRAVSIPLEDLDRQKQYDHTAACLIRPQELLKKERYTVHDLVRIMRRLRGADGCPWDLAQTHLTLRPYLIEEAYETSQAILDEDWDHAADELGDVLLQIIFQADIGRQYGTFDLSDITTAICRKMIKRHPHVFGNTKAETAEDVRSEWEAIKQRERGQKTVSQMMEGVADSLPALMRASKVIKKAAAARIFPEKPAEAAGQLASGAERAAKAGACRDEAAVRRMAGDLLLDCVNCVRLMGAEPETALTDAVSRLIKRFGVFENMAKNSGKTLKDLTLDEISVYWKRSGCQEEAE